MDHVRVTLALFDLRNLFCARYLNARNRENYDHIKAAVAQAKLELEGLKQLNVDGMNPTTRAGHHQTLTQAKTDVAAALVEEKDMLGKQKSLYDLLAELCIAFTEIDRTRK